MFTAGDLLAFGFSDQLVDRIMRFLGESAVELIGSAPGAVVQTAFGGAPASVECSGHAGKARQKVVKAITDMVDGLQRYETSIDGMRRRAYQVEETTVSDINRLIVRAEDCAAAPTVSSPSQCVPPTEGDS